VASSAEAFVLMMRAAGATLMGAPTRGASANPKLVELGQGISVRIPSWRAMLPDGSYFEGVGIPPDIAVPVTPDEVAAGDKVLDAAVAELRKRIRK
jgi:carboxyl-terminal processing protease